MSAKVDLKLASVLKHVTALLAATAALVYLWPHLPRSTELANGCSLTTSGTVASLYGTLFSLATRLGTGVFVFFIVVSVLAFLGWLRTSTSTCATNWRAKRKARRECEEKRRKEESEFLASCQAHPITRHSYPKPFRREKAKPVPTAKYANLPLLKHKTPSLLLRLADSFYRSFAQTKAEAYTNLSWMTMLVSLVLHVGWLKNFVCLETSKQVTGFIVSGILVTALSCFVVGWLFVTTWPTKPTLAYLDTVFGSAAVARDGRVAKVEKLPLLRLFNTADTTLDSIVRRYVPQTMSSSVTIKDSRLNIRLYDPNLSRHTRNLPHDVRNFGAYCNTTIFYYQVVFEDGVLRVGPAPTTGSDLFGPGSVSMMLSDYITIDAFAQLIGLILRDVIDNDQERIAYSNTIDAWNAEVVAQIDAARQPEAPKKLPPPPAVTGSAKHKPKAHQRKRK